MNLRGKKRTAFLFLLSAALCTASSQGVSAYWRKGYEGDYFYADKYYNAYTGWQTINGKEYYFDKSGVMQTGWVNSGDSEYYFDKNGVMQTGFIYDNLNEYYLDAEGVMQTGIIEVDGSIYIISDNGVVRKGNVIIDGQFYTLNDYGQVISRIKPTPKKKFNSFGVCTLVLHSSSSFDDPEDTSFYYGVNNWDKVRRDTDNIETYEVEFEDSDDDFSYTREVQEGHKIVLFEPTKSGYTFEGWEYDGKMYYAGEELYISDDITFTAEWE
ncbi:InlB B-repeat-containing protein [Clostridium sp. BJN0001]|uniref:InlB B-repeat-containing protein n=1 Tax=Clostridium sp. BJN0001 TaxID=2930219 RepID=UPI001FD45BA6|nr:InlB B-repeat-containing protein [Clostridium sp. BJN0001]